MFAQTRKRLAGKGGVACLRVTERSSANHVSVLRHLLVADTTIRKLPFNDEPLGMNGWIVVVVEEGGGQSWVLM